MPQSSLGYYLSSARINSNTQWVVYQIKNDIAYYHNKRKRVSFTWSTLSSFSSSSSGSCSVRWLDWVKSAWNEKVETDVNFKLFRFLETSCIWVIAWVSNRHFAGLMWPTKRLTQWESIQKWLSIQKWGSKTLIIDFVRPRRLRFILDNLAFKDI